jgi:uncharacterized protein YijF (DUF1287 family)
MTINIIQKRGGSFVIMFLLLFWHTNAQEISSIKFCNAAVQLTKQAVVYDPTYFKITYPNGDIPSDKGVCTDVVIRAYRLINIDLQKLVHEDMKMSFNKYPKNWD